MSQRIGVLVIHGMGSQGPGFSGPLAAEVNRRIGDAASRLVWQEVHWADAIRSREDDLWRAMDGAAEPAGGPVSLGWRSVRDFVLHNFGDAIAYHRDFSPASAYTAVHAIVSNALTNLQSALADPAAPIVVIAHSLGGHMMSNYLWDRQHHSGSAPDGFEPIPTLAGMITFGCNIPLLALAFPTAKPIDLPGAGVTNPALREAVRWLNFLDRDDVLGWPLRALYEKDIHELTDAQKETVARIEDHEIDVGSILTSWNPASHDRYWTDNDFTRPAAAYLRSLLNAI